MADKTKHPVLRRSILALGGQAAEEKRKQKITGCAAYFALGFAMSAARILGTAAPFGPAMVAAAGPEMAGVAALLGACLGYVVTGGLDWGIRYVASCMLTYTASFVFQDLPVYRRRSFMPMVTACIAAVTTVLGNIAVSRQGVPLAARLFLEILLSGGCVYFFSEALSDRERTTERGEMERSISIVVLLACLLMTLSRIQLFGYLSVGRILCCLVIMVAAMCAGMFPGCAVGTVMGIAMDATITMAPFFTMAYALCGVVSGVFNRHGRLIFLLSFVGTNAAAVACAWSSGGRIESMYEVFVASVLFMMVPRSVLNRVELLVRNTAMGYGETGLRRYTAGRVYGMSSAFSALCDTVRTVSEDESNDQDISKIFDRAADRVCISCKRKNECWNKNYIDMLTILNDVTPKMMARGKLESDDFPAYFRTACSRHETFVSAVNGELRRNAYRRMMKLKLDENTKAVLEQYADFSQILCEVSQEIGSPHGSDPLAERRLIRYLHSLDMEADTAVFRDAGGRMRITIESAQMERLLGESNYLDKLSEVLGIRLCRPRAEGEETGRMILLEAEPLAVTVGIAAMKKKGERVNGDKGRYFKTDGGQLCVILSDGLGTGTEAAKESTTVVELLEKFLRCGVPPASSMKILNSVMLLKNRDSWGYATVDLMCIDLFSGESCFYKYGAAPSYVKTARGIRKIKGTSLSAGMGTGEQNAPDVVRMMLRPGNVAVIASDGVTAGKTDEEMKTLIETYGTGDMKTLARQVLMAAEQDNEQSDDMTVLTVRLEERR